MAIEKQIQREETPTKYPYPNAYVRVNNVFIRTDIDLAVWIDVVTYPDIQARQEAKQHVIDKKEFKISLSDFVEKGIPTAFTIPEIKAAAYRYLKAIGITGKDV